MLIHKRLVQPFYVFAQERLALVSNLVFSFEFLNIIIVKMLPLLRNCYRLFDQGMDNLSLVESFL